MADSGDSTLRLWQVFCDFEDGSRSHYDGLTLGDTLAIVGTLDNLAVTACTIEPTGPSDADFTNGLTCDWCGLVPEEHGDSDAGPMTVCPPKNGRQP